MTLLKIPYSGTFACGGRAIVVTAAALIAGCTLPSARTSAPDVLTELPAEVASSDREVMVLVQMKRVGNPPRQWVEPPIVVKPGALGGAVRDFNMQETERVLAPLMIPGVPVPTFIFPYVYNVSVSSLDRLCIVTLDGWEFGIAASGGRWAGADRTPLDESRRGALVAALKADGMPFSAVDGPYGPCGVTGAAHWPAETRARAVEFLSTVKPREPAAMNPRLAALAKRARQGREGATRESAMLLATGSWRGGVLAAPPLFLSSDDFREFEALAGETGDSDIYALIAAYSPPAHARGGLRNLQLCVIGSNGERVTRNADHSWRRTAPAAIHFEWREEMLARLKGAGTGDWIDDCIPAHPAGWSDADVRAAAAFLERLPVGPSSTELARMRACSAPAG